MNTETIGQSAGVVWGALTTADFLTIKQLKKITKMRADKELFAALGWLAREGKIRFQEATDTPDHELLVSLFPQD